jgi:hypothetical protein
MLYRPNDPQPGFLTSPLTSASPGAEGTSLVKGLSKRRPTMDGSAYPVSKRIICSRSSLSFAEFLMREPNAHFSSATLIRRGRLTAILECGLKNLFTASESSKSLDPNDH